MCARASRLSVACAVVGVLKALFTLGALAGGRGLPSSGSISMEKAQ